MGIARAVSDLSSLLLAHVSKRGPDADQGLARALEAIASMEDFRQRQRLDLWETECQRCLGNCRTEVGPDHALARLLYDLGACNLYGAIDVRRTRDRYTRVLAELEARGLANATETSVDLDDW